jgi:hypothetical protein
MAAMTAAASPPPEDPVLVRRGKIAAWCSMGKRVGYSIYGIAIVLFFVGLAAGFDHGIATIITVALVTGAVFLVPAIVFGYGVKAAERDEADQAGRAGSH